MEFSPRAWKLTSQMADRIKKDMGVALIIDKGKDEVISNSLVACKLTDGDEVDVLEDPGSASLSTFVDFAAIKKVAEGVNEVRVYGPISPHRLNRNFIQNSLGYNGSKLLWSSTATHKVLCLANNRPENEWIASCFN
jgi:hypothetical protein